MENALRSLRDIDGVVGSFLLDQHGELVARDMPGIFDEGTLRSASRRLGQLRAAFEANGYAFDGCSARFGVHLVVLRAAARRTLCVVCPVGTNLSTLQMGLNLVARRAQELPDRASSPPALRPSLPPPAPMQPPATPNYAEQQPPPQGEALSEPAQSTTRFFRGRPVL
jgi:hypothetical protein